MIFDTHAHYDSGAFNADREAHADCLEIKIGRAHV